MPPAGVDEEEEDVPRELPPGWRATVDAVQEKYYYYKVDEAGNTISSTVTWERPKKKEEMRPPPPLDEELPLGWKSAMDPQTRKYYYFQVDKDGLAVQSTWEKPKKTEDLPPGWRSNYDATEKNFYYWRIDGHGNDIPGTETWTRPSAQAAQPQARPPPARSDGWDTFAPMPSSATPSFASGTAWTIAPGMKVSLSNPMVSAAAAAAQAPAAVAHKPPVESTWGQPPSFASDINEPVSLSNPMVSAAAAAAQAPAAVAHKPPVESTSGQPPSFASDINEPVETRTPLEFSFDPRKPEWGAAPEVDGPAASSFAARTAQVGAALGAVPDPVAKAWGDQPPPLPTAATDSKDSFQWYFEDSNASSVQAKSVAVEPPVPPRAPPPSPPGSALTTPSGASTCHAPPQPGHFGSF
eukprot:TRINITY_DN21219_c0_g1_i2.p1 TRINITY_DN21219_c0_g1~~TRINITY_DN21219_c0_g1_i2.p1  ORF type:complete len:453 (+),score=109.62 TRINITY_DN21219_c0_g1_i2:131-1360(+)